MKKAISMLKSNSLTFTGGGFLLLSFLLKEIFNVKIPPYLDPAWISIFISGIPLFILAIKRIIKNNGISKISSALLISIAMIAAICIGDIFAAGEIAFIMALGEILEDKTTNKAKKGLEKLINLSPAYARRINNTIEEMVPCDTLKENDIVRVIPGETIPADGIIISGETSVDQSIITGESLPIDKTIDDEIYCGTTNLYGSIDFKVTNAGENSSLNRLIKLVENAEKNKAPIQRIADKWASLLVPVAMIIAIIAGLLKQNLTVAVTVLVVFCPCALVLATPTAIMAAIGQATKHGVIIKSGESIEKLSTVDTIAFDKTGTLTHGKTYINEIISFSDEIATNELISMTASVECKSEHPLGKAICAHAKENNISLVDIDNFKSYWGKGVSAVLNNNLLLCGNEKLMAENQILIPKQYKEKIDASRNNGITCVITALNKKAIGAFLLSDKIKDKSSDTIKNLKSIGIETILLTGDNEKTANYFTAKIPIDKAHADLLPEDKLEIIEKLKNDGHTVCMIGDGVNDAPALKTSDVGIAMATIGSDISVDASDIAILGDDISKIIYLKRLSDSTVNTIKFSIFLSLIINLIAIILSVLGLLSPTTGALVHNCGSLFVILIAAKLYDKKIL